MTCDTCGYPNVTYDGRCPICAKNEPEAIPIPLGTHPEEYDPEVEYAPPEPPIPHESDGPNFWIALIGFFFPLAGLILYFVECSERPLRSRSALRGTAWGVGINIVLALLIVLAGNA